MTNEQAVVEAHEKIEALKQEYMSFLGPLALKIHGASYSPKLEEILKCQQLGNKYFNFLDTFVSNSGLLGAHSNGIWITGLAEDCYSFLDVYVDHINFLRSHSSILPNGNVEPYVFACSNMQRMVKEYLSKESSNFLQTKYIANNLPVNRLVAPE